MMKQTSRVSRLESKRHEKPASRVGHYEAGDPQVDGVKDVASYIFGSRGSVGRRCLCRSEAISSLPMNIRIDPTPETIE